LPTFETSLTFWAGMMSDVSSQATLPSLSVKVIVSANGPCGLSSVSSQAPMNLAASAVINGAGACARSADPMTAQRATTRAVRMARRMINSF
jgi:hypothetical protein